MHRVVLLCASLLVGDVREYTRPLDAKKLDQATVDAEAYGEKKGIKRDDAGLLITVAPGKPETGWKMPQTLRIGGDFTITANFAIRKLPKPAQEDGVAVGIAIATQNLDQPEATLLRLTEVDGAGVFRTVDKPMANMNQMQMMQMQMFDDFGQPIAPAKPKKSDRKTFPAKGETFRMELRREGPTVRYFVLDGASDSARYLGQIELGTNDVAGVKLFVSNRNGGDAVEVVLKDYAVRADRITGLGTEVRTVFGEVVHGDPTSIEDGKLIIGGPPKGAKPNAGPAAPGPALPVAVVAPESSDEIAEAQVQAGGAPVVMMAQPGMVVIAGAPMAAPPAAPAAAPPPATAPAPAAASAGAAPPAQAAPAAFVNVSAFADVQAFQEPPPPPPGMPTGPDAFVSNPNAAPKVEPKAKLPLDQVEVIAFERAFVMSGRFLGQPNLDFTMAGPDAPKEGAATPAPTPTPAQPAAKADDVTAPPPGTVAAVKIAKLEPKPNGIRDLYLSLANLRNAAIKQVTITTQTDKGPANWRLDTADSHDWPLVLRRAGTETWADLFLEPPAGDLNGKALMVNIIYADGQNANANINVTEKTDPKLAFDAKAPAPSLDARVYLTGDEQLFGRFESFNGESLRLRTPWGDKLVVPLARVVGIYMGLPEHKESAESFARRLRTRGTEDLLLATAKNGEVVAIAGIAEGTEGDKLLFHFQEKTRSLPLKQVEGLVLASRPEPERPKGIRPTFSLSGGLVVSGLWKDLDTETWKVETAWGQTLNLPANEIRGVRFRGGEMTYLSDLVPSKVEETPFFTRRASWRKDVNLTGGPLKIAGRTYERGLAVHSRTVLTYELEGRYATFDATVGFDESAKGIGRVDCRVFADDKELYANADLRASAAPVKLALPVAKAQRLRLVVDFGPEQDTGDRVIWANARLFRSPPAVTAQAGSGK